MRVLVQVDVLAPDGTVVAHANAGDGLYIPEMDRGVVDDLRSMVGSQAAVVVEQIGTQLADMAATLPAPRGA